MRQIAISPGGDMRLCMSPHTHINHPAIVARLIRAEGHLRSIVTMIEDGRPCLDLATQLHAVERALAEAKRALIHDHIDHCLAGGGVNDLAKLKAMTKLL